MLDCVLCSACWLGFDIAGEDACGLWKAGSGGEATGFCEGGEVASCYGEEVEDLFRTAKSLMRTRPISHSSDAAIRGHVFCSFLALVLRKELQARCDKAGITPEWADILRDLDRLQEITIERDGQKITLRTPTQGTIGPLFKAAGIALPKNLRDAAA